MAPVNKGDEILIPLFDGSLMTVDTVKWQQNFSARQEPYYRVQADNITTGKLILSFLRIILVPIIPLLSSSSS